MACFQQLRRILQIKQGLLVKVVILKIIHQALMVLMVLLISGVTVGFFLRRSPNDFVIMFAQPNKHYQVQITEANLNVRKMTVTDFVLSLIEKTDENTRNIQLN